MACTNIIRYDTGRQVPDGEASPAQARLPETAAAYQVEVDPLRGAVRGEGEHVAAVPAERPRELAKMAADVHFDVGTQKELEA